MYSIIFCVCAIGPSRADGGMFFIVSCRCVVKVVTLIATMSTMTTAREAQESVWRKTSLSCAPKSVDDSMSAATDWVIGPIGSASPVEMLSRPFSTRNRAKKIGDWSRIGMQEANGLVPCFR